MYNAPDDWQLAPHRSEKVTDLGPLPDGTNHVAVDRFTVVHLLVGLGLGAVGIPLPIVAGIAIGWEIVERPLKREFRESFPNPSQDSPENMVFDVAAMMGGWWLTR